MYNYQKRTTGERNLEWELPDFAPAIIPKISYEPRIVRASWIGKINEHLDSRREFFGDAHPAYGALHDLPHELIQDLPEMFTPNTLPYGWEYSPILGPESEAGDEPTGPPAEDHQGLAVVRCEAWITPVAETAHHGGTNEHGIEFSTLTHHSGIVLLILHDQDTYDYGLGRERFTKRKGRSWIKAIIPPAVSG